MHQNDKSIPVFKDFKDNKELSMHLIFILQLCKLHIIPRYYQQIPKSLQKKKKTKKKN
jgi:hypothetical protein